MRIPARRRVTAASGHYGLALVLLGATIVAMAFASDTTLGRLLAVSVESLALLVILRSAQVSRRVLRGAGVVVAVGVVSAVLSAQAAEEPTGFGVVAVGALLALVAPVVVVRSLVRHERVDLTTVAGALCVYLLAGIFFAFVYGVIGELDDQGFFAQQASARDVDYVYFSFVTLATLGYGDLTPRNDPGRMLAVAETLLGQLYLVSVVALLVGNVGRTRPARARDPGPADG